MMSVSGKWSCNRLLPIAFVAAGLSCAAAPCLVAQDQSATQSQQQPANVQGRWTEQHANDWYSKQPWPLGADYVPDDAINQFEMWQADTFDPKQIDKEFGWAESLGMNTMRVFSA